MRGVAKGPTPRSSFQEFLPSDAIENVPEYVQARIFNSEFTRVQCYLADSWRFEEIDRDSRKCAGHAYELRKHASVAEIVVKAVYDLEITARSLHPALSCAATADFFRSWQVWRHVAEFCYEVELLRNRAQIGWWPRPDPSGSSADIFSCLPTDIFLRPRNHKSRWKRWVRTKEARPDG